MHGVCAPILYKVETPSVRFVVKDNKLSTANLHQIEPVEFVPKELGLVEYSAET